MDKFFFLLLFMLDTDNKTHNNRNKPLNIFKMSEVEAYLAVSIGKQKRKKAKEQRKSACSNHTN